MNVVKSMIQTYTKESFTKLQDALVAAKTVLNKNDATNQDVETAYNTLKEAKDQLVKKETNQSVSSTTDKKDNTSSTNKKDNSTSSKVKTGDDTPLLGFRNRLNNVHYCMS